MGHGLALSLAPKGAKVMSQTIEKRRVGGNASIKGKRGKRALRMSYQEWRPVFLLGVETVSCMAFAVYDYGQGWNKTRGVVLFGFLLSRKAPLRSRIHIIWLYDMACWI